MAAWSPRAALEPLLVSSVSVALAVLLTWPLATKLGRVGRADSQDGRFSIWNVAWVARTLVLDPLHVYDANIFYPERGTLAYSENNLGAGALAIPAYWITRNPYFAYNFVLVFTFVLSAITTYYLARHLTGQRGAAAAAALGFAFCPYVFARTPHIQLMMTAGIPLSLLAFHRFVERRTAGRAAAVGLALVAQALSSGYFGIFAALAVGFGALFYAMTRRLWREPRYWAGLAIASAVALILIGPFFLPYLRLKSEAGFTRSLEEAAFWSADWRAYLASSAHAHGWLLKIIGRWNETLFPGFVISIFGLAGIWLGARASIVGPGTSSSDGHALPARDTTAFYGLLLALAFWASLGPKAGLYLALHQVIPIFTFLRAPARFGIVVSLGLAILTACAMARLMGKHPRWRLLPVVLALIVVVESLRVPLRMPSALPIPTTYRVLAQMPPGPVAEFPFFFRRGQLVAHALYMLYSTAHWRPLINGYSDYIPPGYREMAEPIASFPSPEAFEILRRHGARYVVLHWSLHSDPRREYVREQLPLYRPYLLPLVTDGDVWLYEIVDWPAQPADRASRPVARGPWIYQNSV